MLVLGSQPPLEDCYRPDLVPGREALEREHAEHAEHLAAAGVDAVLVETMNTVREGVAAAAAVRAAGLPLLLSWICWDGARLLSGEPLAAALDAGSAASPDAMLVNCLPPSNVAACTEVLSALPGAWGVYANLGEPAAETGFARSEDCTPTEFADLAAGWVAAGARIVGGCCGTTPAHLRAVVSRVCNSTPGPAASRVG